MGGENVILKRITFSPPKCISITFSFHNLGLFNYNSVVLVFRRHERPTGYGVPILVTLQIAPLRYAIMNRNDNRMEKHLHAALKRS